MPCSTETFRAGLNSKPSIIWNKNQRVEGVDEARAAKTDAHPQGGGNFWDDDLMKRSLNTIHEVCAGAVPLSY